MVRAFEAHDRGFHLKTYIFQTDVEGIAFVGSSNLSAPALTSSIEWNYKVISSHEKAGFLEITAGFENIFNNYQSVPADEAWIRRYEARRTSPNWRSAEVADEPPAPIVIPHSIQQRALEALLDTRRAGYSAGLVVLATGLGKTWLSAFDSHRTEFNRVLFVAHREEILNQAISNFRQVRPNASIGRMMGAEKESSADIVFASVQTLGRIEHLKQIHSEGLRLHHSRRIPSRGSSDLSSNYRLFRTEILARVDSDPRAHGRRRPTCPVPRKSRLRGIRARRYFGRLALRLQYFGVPDVVDYTNIPWRNARFDPAELTAAVATEARAQNALGAISQAWRVIAVSPFAVRSVMPTS